MNVDNIVVDVQSLTDKLGQIEQSKLDPELLAALSNLHSAIFKAVSRQRNDKVEVHPLNCTIEQLLRGDKAYNDKITERILNYLCNYGVNNVGDLYEKLSTNTSPKKIFEKRKFIKDINNFGEKCYDFLFDKLKEKKLIDSEGVWLL